MWRVVFAVFLVGCAVRGGAVARTERPGALGESVADRTIAARPPERLRFDWGPAVLLVGLQRMAAVRPGRAAAYRDYVARFHRHHARPVVRRADHCGPGLTRPVPAVDAYLSSASRDAIGAIDHLGRVGGSIWVDSLIFVGLTATASRDPELRAFGLSQPRIYAEHLQDPTGLFRHAYAVERGRPRPRAAVFWGRGNGWAAWALVDTLGVMPPSHPDRVATALAWRRLAAAVIATQRDDGRWSTVLGDDRTYAETSATALLAYALAKGARLGLLDADARDAARKAYAALALEIHDGHVHGISGPTLPSNRAGYLAVPRARDHPWGVGAFLLISAELALDE